MTSPRELVTELVETPSVSGDEDACADRLVEYFHSHDREAWVDAAGNVRAPGDDDLLLTSHLDTVPGDIPVRVEDGVLWGRGSVDAKGSLAALAVTAVRSGATFAGVVDEERRSRGARHLVEDRSAPDAVVNGEPSGWNGVTLGYRGLLTGTYVTTSESGHSSRPENNAIQDAFAWWNRVETAVGRDEWHSAFERVTPKPVAVDGGPTADGLSIEATVDVEFRIPPDRTTDDLREIADSCLKAGTVNWRDAVEPVFESPRTPVARAFRGAIRAADGEPRMLRKTGTSDMNVYAEVWDCPIVSYGPGDSEFDHAPDERLPLASFDRAVTVLDGVTERLV